MTNSDPLAARRKASPRSRCPVGGLDDRVSEAGGRANRGEGVALLLQARDQNPQRLDRLLAVAATVVHEDDGALAIGRHDVLDHGPVAS